MKYEFHPEALEEYREAAGWYGNREPGLAIRFVGEVEDAIRQILDAPDRWRVIDEDIRRCLNEICIHACRLPMAASPTSPSHRHLSATSLKRAAS